MAEIIRAGIESVDKGQMEAARSLGLPYWRAMYRVVLPQAIRTMIPSIINQFIITLKDTSILSVIPRAGQHRQKRGCEHDERVPGMDDCCCDVPGGHYAAVPSGQKGREEAQPWASIKTMLKFTLSI